jgi:hypothetical protein
VADPASGPSASLTEASQVAAVSALTIGASLSALSKKTQTLTIREPRRRFTRSDGNGPAL